MGSGKKLGKIGKLIKKVDPLRGGDRVLEAVGLPTMTGEGENNILDMGATQAEAAAKAQAEQAEAAARTEREAAETQAQAIRDQTTASMQSQAQQQQLLQQQMNDNAANAARQASLNADRERASASAAETAAADSTPSVTLGPSETATSKRKRYSANSLGGTSSSGGGSIRI